MNWVKLKRYCELSGDTPNAVHAKRKRGLWIDGMHCKIAADGKLWINTQAVEEWVEGGEPGGAKASARGVTIRRNSKSVTIRIAFSYRGVECRETLKLEPTSANKKYAANLKAEIDSSIARGTFHYSEYFPNSRRARMFGQASSSVTLADLFEDFLKICKNTLEASTYRSYKSMYDARLKPAFGALRPCDLKPGVLRKWISELGLTLKYVRNVLSPLRIVLDQAVDDELIPFNPLDKIKAKKLVNKDSAKTDYEVDPCAPEEIEALSRVAQGQLRNLIRFGFFSGLRISELMAL